MNKLTIYKTIRSYTLEIPELESWIRKDVQIKITQNTKSAKKNAIINNKLSSYDLGGSFDNLNIRDLAYED